MNTPQQPIRTQTSTSMDMVKVREWLNVLGVFLIPLMVIIYTITYNAQQSNIANDTHKADLALQADQQRETALASYIHDMKDLISTAGLQTSKPGDEVRVIARAQTLITLRQLDGTRKGLVMQFLSEAKLITRIDIKEDVIIDLSGADLSGAILINAFLSGALLSGALLIHAILRGADLSGAILRGADLSGAVLINAFLSGALLINAKITKEQLDKTFSLSRTVMPDGSIHL